MEFLKPPSKLVEAMPEGPLRDFVGGWGWYVILGIGALILLLIVWSVIRALTSKQAKPAKSQSLEEDLGEYPPPPPRTGDRRLLVEGVPVRMRLVVVAPAGGQAEDYLELDKLDRIMERILPGLGQIFKEDKPRVKRWPRASRRRRQATGWAVAD